MWCPVRQPRQAGLQQLLGQCARLTLDKHDRLGDRSVIGHVIAIEASDLVNAAMLRFLSE